MPILLDAHFVHFLCLGFDFFNTWVFQTHFFSDGNNNDECSGDERSEISENHSDNLDENSMDSDRDGALNLVSLISNWNNIISRVDIKIEQNQELGGTNLIRMYFPCFPNGIQTFRMCPARNCYIGQPRFIYDV